MSLILVIEADSCFRECKDCGDKIPDPYLEDDDEEEGVLCSTCDAERARNRRLKRRTNEHLKPVDLPPAICDCGKLLPDCTVATCHRDEPLAIPRRTKAAARKPENRQRKLFD